MADSENRSSSNQSYQSLLLRVRRPDGHLDEVYLAEGLTIGRSQANTIRLADEPNIARAHARVIIANDGAARLTCLDSEAGIAVDGATVQELQLRPGAVFQIGQNVFECVSGLRLPFREAMTAEPSCPFCGEMLLAPTPEGSMECAGCRQPLFVLAAGAVSRRRFILPAQFGSYRVGHFVARGGMGLILKGADDRRPTPVAIKLLLPTKGVGTSAAERFKQEVTLLKSVRHPNVVRLLDYGRVGRLNYLILDWVAGPSLREALSELRRHRKQLPFDQAIRWFEQICRGLAALHAVGIVHRDLKPSNILIAPTGEALISDLGIAKHVDQSTALTATGEIPGTIEYMAPEQLSDPDAVDARTDLYALGVVFYEMLTGERPTGAWLPASQINTEVPASVDQIVTKLLQRSPSERYGGINDLQVAVILAARLAEGQVSGVSTNRCAADESLPFRAGRVARKLPWVAIGILQFIIIVVLICVALSKHDVNWVAIIVGLCLVSLAWVAVNNQGWLTKKASFPPLSDGVRMIEEANDASGDTGLEKLNQVNEPASLSNTTKTSSPGRVVWIVGCLAWILFYFLAFAVQKAGWLPSTPPPRQQRQQHRSTSEPHQRVSTSFPPPRSSQ